MASIRWGLGTGADLCLPFVGNATLSGCRVIGAGGADDDIALAWNEAEADANTRNLYRFDDAGYDGTPGEVVDASGNGYHGKMEGSGVTVVDGWMGKASSYNGSGNIITTDTGSWLTSAWTIEVWLLPNSLWMQWAGVADKRTTYLSQTGYCLQRNATGARLFGTTGWNGAGGGVTVDLINYTDWTHWALVFNGGTLGLYRNGVLKASRLDNPPSYTAQGTLFLGKTYDGNRYRGLVDDLRVSNVARYSSDFSPVRYKSAAQNSGTQPYVQASNAGLTGAVPAAVSWSATVGSGYGQVKRVWVNGSAGWVQVGGDYPVSPVAVSGLVLPSADAVRVELEPEQVSGIQNETPVLDWVQLEYTAPATGGRVYRPTPLRFGPKLLPIGVLA